MVPAEIEKLSRQEKINDYLLTSLRTHWGASLSTLQLRWAYDLEAEKGEYLLELSNNGYCILADERITLTEKGFLPGLTCREHQEHEKSAKTPD